MSRLAIVCGLIMIVLAMVFSLPMSRLAMICGLSVMKKRSTNCEPTFKCHVLSGANSWIVARHIGHSASCTTHEEQKPL
jgi:hypothetical protein